MRRNERGGAKFKILVAEDEEITLENLVQTLRESGYEAAGVLNGQVALARMAEEQFDVLIADVKMPGMSGLELLEKAKAQDNYPGTEVIILTGYGSIRSAVEAMQKGAFDYLTKPFDLDELVLRVKKIHEQRALRRENTAFRTYFGMDKSVRIIGKSPSMARILNTIEEIKDSDAHILLTGETGVGKSLIAKIVHFTSRRRSMPFLSLNCATLTEELLASELFGHEKGAFTGAVGAKPGLVEVADTGTLFLDEVAELTPNLQAKLLKVVEEGEFFHVGGTRAQSVDVRFLAATNQDLKALIREGRFREDLYYRLNVLELFVPPLRERREDIAPLAEFFLEKHLPKTRKRIEGFSDEVLDILSQYSFPGNVRELENIVERAIILEQGPRISPESLPQGIRVLRIDTFDAARVKTVDEVVKEHAENVVRLLGGNRTKAANQLGISRTSLWKLLKGEGTES
jgi:two-component system response regulator HydG